MASTNKTNGANLAGGCCLLTSFFPFHFLLLQEKILNNKQAFKNARSLFFNVILFLCGKTWLIFTYLFYGNSKRSLVVMF